MQNRRTANYARRSRTFARSLEIDVQSGRCTARLATNVEWKLQVTLVIRGAPDVFKELPLTILSTSESYASWAESDPYLDSHGLCEMDVPKASGPCLETDQTYVAWRLRAVLKRRMAFDPEVHLLLNVYNGPTTTVEC